MQSRPGSQCLVEPRGEFGGNAVVDRLRGGNDRRHAGVEQPLHLGLRRTAVEEDELEAALAGEECGEAPRVGGLGMPRRRLQEEPITVGVVAVVEDGDPVAVARVLENIEHLRGRGVLADRGLAESRGLSAGSRVSRRRRASSGRFRK